METSIGSGRKKNLGQHLTKLNAHRKALLRGVGIQLKEAAFYSLAFHFIITGNAVPLAHNIQHIAVTLSEKVPAWKL